MTYRYRGIRIDRIAVVGSGQIGPDIALHFTKVMQPHGVPVVVTDISDEALKRGRARLEKKVRKGEQTGAFRPGQAQAMIDNVTFTTDEAALDGASLVVEAATEDATIKRDIFRKMRKRCPDAVLASNSSHLEPEAIFDGIDRPDRCLVIHYFFPAERNLAVELVPGAQTDPALLDGLLGFYEQIGKAPIRVASRYGYAIDPVFEGLFLAAALCVEAGEGSVKEVDVAAARALGLGVGPFTAMNLTGGNPITHHGLQVMGEKFGSWWRSPDLMQRAMASGEPWEVAARGETVEVPAAKEQRIGDLMKGAYFGLAGQVLDSGIVDISDFELGLEVGLDIRPAFSMMNGLGVQTALDLVIAYAQAAPGFEVPRCLTDQAKSGSPWRVQRVLRRDHDDVAVLTIRRPRVLNALDEGVFEEIETHADAIATDAAISSVVLTGFGTKAFVSGADVNFLAGIESPEQGAATSNASKRAGDRLEQLGKPVICAMNGFAIGGGAELAMCCSARICRKGLKVAVQQPEVNLGIIPGAGGTQRLPRLVGMELAADMMRTTKPLSSRQAVEAGFAREEVEGDLIETAIDLARAAARGTVALPAMATEPFDVPASLPAVELGHLSPAIDAILCRALLEGCAKPLAEGLRFESDMFGECTRTADMRIGMRNFLENGPRRKASFTGA